MAAELLEEFADGVWWVDLAALSVPDLLAGAVASAMGIPETSGAPLMDVLAGVVAGRRTLVVLDNCEHLVDACAALCQTLLEAGPRLVVLATSREPLGLEGETTWRVPSLTVAEETAPTTSLIDCEAARLFVDRATHARPTFRLSDEGAHTLVRICRRLDGIPLALELAAARTRVQIASGLDDRFRLLVSGRRTALSRQRTLEASVDWSYGLLDDDQRTLLRRLSVFAGTFDLEAAEAVGAGDGLEPRLRPAPAAGGPIARAAPREGGALPPPRDHTPIRVAKGHRRRRPRAAARPPPRPPSPNERVRCSRSVEP